MIHNIIYINASCCCVVYGSNQEDEVLRAYEEVTGHYVENRNDKFLIAPMMIRTSSDKTNKSDGDGQHYQLPLQDYFMRYATQEEYDKMINKILKTKKKTFFKNLVDTLYSCGGDKNSLDTSTVDCDITLPCPFLTHYKRNLFLKSKSNIPFDVIQSLLDICESVVLDNFTTPWQRSSFPHDNVSESETEKRTDISCVNFEEDVSIKRPRILSNMTNITDDDDSHQRKCSLLPTRCEINCFEISYSCCQDDVDVFYQVLKTKQDEMMQQQEVVINDPSLHYTPCFFKLNVAKDCNNEEDEVIDLTEDKGDEMRSVCSIIIWFVSTQTFSEMNCEEVEGRSEIYYWSPKVVVDITTKENEFFFPDYYIIGIVDGISEQRSHDNDDDIEKIVRL